MNDNWVKVFTSTDFFKSEMVKQFLVENNIDAVVLNKQGYPYNIGEVEVYVQPKYSTHALELIQQNDL
ncbi:DUF2007 domain-containing protein [Paradesertivirga mongoliensis]|uniref:DUF2007 domain-containing protein n=1 Tax=Paradesertivirga mongoliensis TaxID=2100740 RepID=A0ABW4ZJA9_9SPHI|nr:DUF2007 domain-containing protein [Pedobacter mongoliensis]